MADLTAYWRTSPPANEGTVLLLARFGVRLPEPQPEMPPAPALSTENEARRLADALNALGVRDG